MHSWLNLLLQKGSRSVQLLLSWFLFFGLKINKFSKALGQTLFFHLNMKHEILKMFISYLFNAPISLKRGLECVNLPLKPSNLIECFCWRQRVDNLVFWVEPKLYFHGLNNYVQIKSKVDLTVFLELLASLHKVYLCF